jgi:hypothetical protein
VAYVSPALFITVPVFSERSTIPVTFVPPIALLVPSALDLTPKVPVKDLLATVILCVWLGSVASLLPPVSSAVSKSASEPFKPTMTRPAPKASQVPKPSKVEGFVELVELI